ncbi:hypothetical protein MtrunA17_Chr3g0092661 [Medicago truncatula]|uniref:Transmembrane protein n=1 Tax=Medicago truncatula TaxID=3880 RepID=A0A396IUG5_MEDTR|nr:hypothetical protein MtrunA17_Chr3g0092661 [Medicago truncatula]
MSRAIGVWILFLWSFAMECCMLFILGIPSIYDDLYFVVSVLPIHICSFVQGLGY